MENYRELNARTLELKRRVDDYIRLKLSEPFPKVNQKECLEYIDDTNYQLSTLGTKRYIRISDIKIESEVEKSTAELLEDFVQQKKQELNYNYHSYKKYITLKNQLIDFENNRNESLTFNSMNTVTFIYDFRDYLFEKGYNDNATNMRIKNLKTFMRYIENQELFSFRKVVYDTKVSTYENEINSLSIDDINVLLELEIDNPKWQKIVDVFICNCFLGLRFGDLISLQKSDFFQDSEGNFSIIKDNQKTGLKIEIPVFEPALSILEKYQFELPKYSIQYFNRQLKDILKHYDLFPETIKQKRKVNKMDRSKIVQRRDIITSHVCRRTFATLAIQAKVPLNNIMKATGHTKLSTLDKYVERKQDREGFKNFGLKGEEHNKKLN
jgi:integrase